MHYNITQVDRESYGVWLEMCLALWPDNPREEMEKDMNDLISSGKETAFLYEENGVFLGFVNVSLRTDYVEGARTSPVGYIEGIYVKPCHRKRGIGRLLVRHAEEWAMGNGCRQMASDAELHNTASQAFHGKAGFCEENKIVCYIKEIEGVT
ncbi:MAG: GNAT family N-acetyltransferase [Clostridia bacterium]